MQRLRKGFLLVLGLGVLLVTAGCSMAAVGGGSSLVRVTADEWSLRSDVSSARVGQVTFEVVNHGRARHEMVLLRTDLAASALKLTASGAEVDESASGQVMGEVEDLGSGQTKTVTLDLAPGRYVLTCNIIGHYKAGMVAALEVS